MNKRWNTCKELLQGQTNTTVVNSPKILLCTKVLTAIATTRVLTEDFKYESSFSLLVWKMMRRNGHKLANFYLNNDNNYMTAEVDAGISYQEIECKNTV